jgi:uncharacterized protein (DUF1330 family)
VVSEQILSRFEKDVNDLAVELNRLAARRKELSRQGDALQGNVEELRRETQAHNNMLKEARLRSLLGELKSNLEQRAEEGRRGEEQHRTFEEQVLSLMVLYNDRIENLLGQIKPSEKGTPPESCIREILGVISRRERIQLKAESIRLGAEQRRMGRFPLLLDASAMDRENLLLARGFLKDREAQLLEQIERSSLEEMEIHRQIKLETRVRNTIENALATHGEEPLIQNGVNVLTQEGGQWKARLLYLNHDQERDRVLLTQTKQYLKKVEQRLKKPLGNSSGKPKSTM